MLRKVTLKNFKAYGPKGTTFELAPITLILGPQLDREVDAVSGAHGLEADVGAARNRVCVRGGPQLSGSLPYGSATSRRFARFTTR